MWCSLLLLDSHSVSTTLIRLTYRGQNHISKLLFRSCHLPAQNLFLDPNYTPLKIGFEFLGCGSSPLLLTAPIVLQSPGDTHGHFSQIQPCATPHALHTFPKLRPCHAASPTQTPFPICHPVFLCVFRNHFKSCPPQPSLVAAIPNDLTHWICKYCLYLSFETNNTRSF